MSQTVCPLRGYVRLDKSLVARGTPGDTARTPKGIGLAEPTVTLIPDCLTQASMERRSYQGFKD